MYRKESSVATSLARANRGRMVLNPEVGQKTGFEEVVGRIVASGKLTTPSVNF
jgi:hypothetical protein